MQLDPATYEQQLAIKVAKISELFEEFSIPALKVFESPRSNYRMRAEFRVWHDGDDLYHVMFDQETKQKKRVDQFLPAGESINQAMTNSAS